MTVIYAVILFVLLIFPHELGHFIVAKAVGVKVNEFAFGMGPALWKKQGKETLYSVRLVPIGGYCAMEGENEESDDDRSFNNKPGWAKISVLLAGAAMNVLIAIAVLSIVMGVIGTPTTEIEEVQSESPAYAAGFQSEDKILSADGQDINAWSDFTGIIAADPDRAHTVTVERDGSEKTFTVTPVKSEDGRAVIGVTCRLSHNVFGAVKNGAAATWDMTKAIFEAFGQLLSGDVSTKDLAGPVGIVTMVSETSDYGLYYFASLVALMSLNLAIINLLPLPALDGGRVIFVIIRAVTGKMISDELEGKIHGFGMVLLIGLMLFVTWNDIVRLLT